MGRRGRSLIALALAAAPARAEPPIGVRSQTVTRSDAQVQVGASTATQASGWSYVPEIVTSVAASARLLDVTLTAQLSYGHGITDDERFGAARLSAMHGVTGRVAAGRPRGNDRARRRHRRSARRRDGGEAAVRDARERSADRARPHIDALSTCAGARRASASRSHRERPRTLRDRGLQRAFAP